MKLNEMVKLLREHYDNGIPISFMSLMNTIKQTGFTIGYKGMHFSKIGPLLSFTLYNDKKNGIYNLVVGFISENDVILIQLQDLFRYSYPEINRLGFVPKTDCKLIERFITDKEIEIIEEE